MATFAELPGVRDGFGDDDYAEFQRRIQAKSGVRLADYKPDQMRRRISTIAERSGFQSFTAYVQAMDRDPGLLSSFLDKMTINVSELVRNPQRFDELFRIVLPKVAAERKGTGPVNIWSAGCSYGAEAYSIAMLFHEHLPTVPYTIVGTDIDTEILSKARSGSFTEPDMNNVAPALRSKYFEASPGGTYLPKPVLRSGISFARQDLLGDVYPKLEYDLIACRNVVIYFTDSAKDRIYHHFFNALKPGGVLFVGGTERLPDHRAIGFELVMPFFYRRPL